MVDSKIEARVSQLTLEEKKQILGDINSIASIVDVILKKNPELYPCIPMPSKWAAVSFLKQSPRNIQYIPNPTIEAMIFAVREFPQAINYIKNPPLEVLEILVVENPDVLYDLKALPPEIVIQLLENDNELFFPEEPMFMSEEDILYALDYSPMIKEITSNWTRKTDLKHRIICRLVNTSEEYSEALTLGLITFLEIPPQFRHIIDSTSLKKYQNLLSDFIV